MTRHGRPRGPDGSPGVEATRRRLSPRQAEVVAAAGAGHRGRGRSGRLRRAHRPQRGPPGRRGPGHRLQLLQLQGPSVGRGAVAAACRHCPRWNPTPDRPVHERVADAVRAMVLFTTESPALVDASTQALLEHQPRRQASARPDRRARSITAWPPRWVPEWIPWWCGCCRPRSPGALLAAGIGHMSSLDIPEFVAAAATLMIRVGRPGRSAAPMTTDRPAGRLQPLRLRDPRGSLPGLRPPAGRGPGVPQRRARLLGPVPPRGRAGRLPQSRRVLQRPGGVARAQRLRARRPQVHVLPGPRPAPPHPDALAGGQGLHPVQGGRRWRTTSGPSPSSTSSRPSSRGRSTSSPTSPASCPWT